MEIQPGRTPSQTSVNRGKKQMPFPEAIKGLLVGEKISRVEWGDETIYLFIQNEMLKIHNNNDIRPVLLNSGDLGAEDWVMV